MFDKFETEIDALNVFNVAMTALIVAIIGVSQNCGGQPICDPDILVPSGVLSTNAQSEHTSREK